MDDSLYAGFKLFGKGIKQMEEMEKIENNFKIVLSLDEKIKCLEELVVRLKKNLTQNIIIVFIAAALLCIFLQAIIYSMAN